ncbi:MAG: hypothetical protein H0T51_24960 [Pirellulales bacterium]|nr:hypothetical protein [Pirellulales bacterium]
MFGSLHPKRLFRFSLGTLLFAMLCACGYFGNYRAGQLAGTQDRYDQLHFMKAYDVSDLMVDLSTTAQRQKRYREITEFLKRTVAADSWKSEGQVTCEIYPFPPVESLAIMQRGAVHDLIEVAMLKFREEFAKEVHPSSVPPAEQESQ